MAMPRVLKNFSVFYDGLNYIGQVKEITLPKLTRKMEDYRGGGMLGPIEIDLGQEKMELDHTYGGLMFEIFEDWGVPMAGEILMRFTGAYEADDTGETDSVEVVMRGRHKEIDPGNAKAGEHADFKVKSALSYYKLIVNGITMIEIDILNMVFIVNGEDRLAAQRAALGF